MCHLHADSILIAEFLIDIVMLSGGTITQHCRDMCNRVSTRYFSILYIKQALQKDSSLLQIPWYPLHCASPHLSDY